MRKTVAILAFGAVLALVLTGLPAAAEQARRMAEIEPQPLHTDARGMQQAMLEALGAFLDDDAAAARAALDRVELGCRRALAEEVTVFGSMILGDDRDFHTALTYAREDAGAGELDKAFEDTILILKACRSCHTNAREQGLLEAGRGGKKDPAGSVK